MSSERDDLTVLAQAQNAVPTLYAEKTMASLMQLHSELMEEKEKRIDLHRRLLDREQTIAELRMYVAVLEGRLGIATESATASASSSPLSSASTRASAVQNSPASAANLQVSANVSAEDTSVVSQPKIPNAAPIIPPAPPLPPSAPSTVAAAERSRHTAPVPPEPPARSGRLRRRIVRVRRESVIAMPPPPPVSSPQTSSREGQTTTSDGWKAW